MASFPLLSAVSQAQPLPNEPSLIAEGAGQCFDRCCGGAQRGPFWCGSSCHHPGSFF
jgi:hypothetical protein